MSTALLKFHEIAQEPFDPAILAAAVEAAPHAMVVTENGKLIYGNPSFAQLMSSRSADGSGRMPTGPGWQTAEFAVAGREYSLTTVRIESDRAGGDLQHLATVGRLVGGVAHDFNNLLTGILLYCDLLQQSNGGTLAGGLWRKADEIRGAAEQGSALIRQFMTVGREEPGEPSSVCFNRVVRELYSLLRHLLGEQVQITMELSEDSALVGITSAQAQIVLNLALNAADARWCWPVM
jgi:signal transduction histidine kinase